MMGDNRAVEGCDPSTVIRVRVGLLGDLAPEGANANTNLTFMAEGVSILSLTLR